MLASDNLVWSTVGVKIIYDLSFFVIISTIGLNVIFGIIVDTFSELRDERYRILDDMQDVCFICSLPSYDFDRYAKGFGHHVKKEHNMWSYLLFTIYLAEKNPSEYTAFEAYVANMIAQDDTTWYPVSRAMSLSKEDTTIEDELRRMCKVLDLLVSRQRENDLRRVEEDNKSSQQKWKQEAQKQEAQETK